MKYCTLRPIKNGKSFIWKEQDGSSTPYSEEQWDVAEMDAKLDEPPEAGLDQEEWL
jgi:hypothetical protein